MRWPPFSGRIAACAARSSARNWGLVGSRGAGRGREGRQRESFTWCQTRRQHERAARLEMRRTPRSSRLRHHGPWRWNIRCKASCSSSSRCALLYSFRCRIVQYAQRRGDGCAATVLAGADHCHLSRRSRHALARDCWTASVVWRHAWRRWSAMQRFCASRCSSATSSAAGAESRGMRCRGIELSLMDEQSRHGGQGVRSSCVAVDFCAMGRFRGLGGVYEACNAYVRSNCGMRCGDGALGDAVSSWRAPLHAAAGQLELGGIAMFSRCWWDDDLHNCQMLLICTSVMGQR